MFDPRPLTDPIDAAAMRAFQQEPRNRGRSFGNANVGQTVMVLVVLVIMMGLIGTIFTILSAGMSLQEGPVAAIASVAFTVLPIVFFGVIIAVVVRSFVRRSGRGTERTFRLEQFARANAMQYRGPLANPPLPGMIFAIGTNRLVREAVYGTEPRFVEIGNYQYVAGPHDDVPRNWGYVAVKLNTVLPHIVLDSIANGNNLANFFGSGEKLTLEGDFNKHFTLWCRAGNETDALYLFTPDVMAQFIDRAAHLDVEIHGEWLFFYSPTDLVTLDPAMWVGLFSLVQTMLTKLDQWERWRAG